MKVATKKVFAHAGRLAIDSFLATSKTYLESPVLLTAARTPALSPVVPKGREAANVSVKPISRWISLRIEAQIKTFNRATRNLGAEESTC